LAFTIALAGKGGTGKTTLAAFIINRIIRAGKGPVLAVDADANANLHEALGIQINDSIADIINRVNKKNGAAARRNDQREIHALSYSPVTGRKRRF